MHDRGEDVGWDNRSAVPPRVARNQRTGALVGPRCACPTPPSRRFAFSIVELLIALVVIGVLTAMCVPSFQRALEELRADGAAANLRAIWCAQRLYWLDNRTFTSDLAGLQSAGMLDPQMVLGNGGYTYTVNSAEADQFTASATRSGGGAWSGALTIDQSGLIAGVIQAQGQHDIAPGFQ